MVGIRVLWDLTIALNTFITSSIISSILVEIFMEIEITCEILYNMKKELITVYSINVASNY